MKKDKSFTWHRVEAMSLNLKGMRVAIIGGTGGIGRALSRLMSSRGASITVVGQTFRDTDQPEINFIKADLGLMTEAKRVAALLPAEDLDILIFTAGIMAGPERQVTSEGLERDLATSYLNRFVMQRELGPRLGKNRPANAPKPRVFNMAFPGSNQIANVDDLNSEKGYRRMVAHSNTVAGNEALVIDGVKRYPHVDFFGLNPGFVKTNIRSNLFGSQLARQVTEWLTGFMTSNPEDYVERLVPLLVSPDLKGHSGAMFDNKADAIQATAKVADTSYVDALMAASEVLTSKTKVYLSS